MEPGLLSSPQANGQSESPSAAPKAGLLSSPQANGGIGLWWPGMALEAGEPSLRRGAVPLFWGCGRSVFPA